MKALRWAFRVGAWQPSEQDWLKLSSCIQTEEKERIGRFVFKRDAKSSMAGRILIRKYISEVTSLRNADIFLSRDDRGKPFLKEPPLNVGVLFNISHQGDYAVIAGIQGTSNPKHLCGVDVMKLEYTGGKTLDEFFRVMERNFSPKEWVSIRGAGGDMDRLRAFCRHWSLKESYVKATGTGITVNLQDLSFVTASPLSTDPVYNTQLFYKNELLSNWTFEESLLDPHHCVSVARNFDCETGKFSELSYNELTSSCEPIIPDDFDYTKKFFAKEEKPF